MSVNASVPGTGFHSNRSNSSMPYLPAREDQLVSPILVGVLNGAKPITQVFVNPVIGCIVDRSGDTVPMMVGFIVAFCSTIGFAYFNTYTLLIVARCVQGLGSSLMTVAGLAMLSTVYRDPEERSRAMSVAFSGLTFGLIVGFPLGSYLYQFAGREIPFICLAGLILLGALIRFGLMPLKLGTKDPRPMEQAGAGGPCEGISVFLDVYIVAAAGVYFWFCYAIGTEMGVGPLFLEGLGAEQWQIGVIFLVGSGAHTISQYVMGVWTFRLGWWPPAMLGLIIVALGLGGFPLVKTLWLILPCEVVYGIGKGFILSSVPPLLGHLADIRVNSQYGAVFALSDTATNLGYFLGSTITGILVDRFSYLIGFASMGVVVVLYSLVCPILRNVPRKYPPVPAVV